MSGNGSTFNPFDGPQSSAQDSQGITTRAFALNLATGLALFAFEVIGFLLLKSLRIGRRIYQPKTYLVQDRLRVEFVPANPFKWLVQVFKISGEELKAKCGLDGYFLIRFIRAMIVIFMPLMFIIVTILLPVNYNGGRGKRDFVVGDNIQRSNVTGIDTLSWQNVAPTHTDRYWAHLLCALLAIGWTLWRIYKEKLHYIKVRQEFLASPEHRLKASARTVLITNIPSEFRSKEALKALYDVFVGDEREKLHVWINRDYRYLRTLVNQRKKFVHALEKEELKILRAVNKQFRHGKRDIESDEIQLRHPATDVESPEDLIEEGEKQATARVAVAYENDCLKDYKALWRQYLKEDKAPQVTLSEDKKTGKWQPASTWKFWSKSDDSKTVPKLAWLRSEVARLTIEIEDITQDFDDDENFHRLHSAFIQFDKQMSAQMAVGLVSHHLPGRMSPRYFNVAPHEVLWPNMGITSLRRFVRGVMALGFFVGMIFLWAVPTSFLGAMSQLDSLRMKTSWLAWLRAWPSWLISFIAGPGSAILLALLVQLVVPALCRKLAVLVGCPTRSTREVVTQRFYFSFLFIELVLVTSISSGLIPTITALYTDPASIPSTLAENLPKAANYFFNYLIIQGLGFSGALLFQYLRLMYITMIWPFFTQTPREEAWLQTTIPHQMWGNVYPLITNFAVIGLIYSIIAPLMLVIVTLVFMVFWIAYKHNYYYVQRVKVDTYGKMFENALTQLFVGIYVLEICLIGLFFLVRNTNANVVATPQAIIMIVVTILTGVFQYVMESHLSPLYDLLPVSLEDTAAEKEKRRFLASPDGQATSSGSDEKRSKDTSPQRTNTSALDGTTVSVPTSATSTAAHPLPSPPNNRKTMMRLRNTIAASLTANEAHALELQPDLPHRLHLAAQLGASIANYPDELSDLTPAEQLAEHRVAYQDPVTREPAPVIWIPKDEAGCSEDAIRRVEKVGYGRWVQYSDVGARLTRKGKCEITRPAPDVRVDWLLDWYL